MAASTMRRQANDDRFSEPSTFQSASTWLTSPIRMSRRVRHDGEDSEYGRTVAISKPLDPGCRSCVPAAFLSGRPQRNRASSVNLAPARRGSDRIPHNLDDDFLYARLTRSALNGMGACRTRMFFARRSLLPSQFQSVNVRFEAAATFGF